MITDRPLHTTASLHPRALSVAHRMCRKHACRGENNMNEKLLTDLFDGIRQTLRAKPSTIDLSFDGTLLRLCCDAEAMANTTLQVYPQANGDPKVRIVGKRGKQDVHTPTCFLFVDVYLPHDQQCDLNIGDICTPSPTAKGWMTIGKDTHWAPLDPMPERLASEFKEKPEGTIWNYQGSLVLAHKGKYYTKFF